MTRTQLNQETVSGLAAEYQFELIPDTEATREAGYTAEDREHAQVWYGPTVDEKFFYYTAWTGAVFSTNHKSSILVCRRRDTGALVYTINCAQYNLDTTANFMGDNTTITRCRPVIFEDTLYLVNAVMSNIGPQLYAVNKKNGALRWAAAYYTPEGAPSYITTKGDYSFYRGSNMRISDLNPKVEEIDGVRYVFVGTSSLQNVTNVGSINTGFPIYTDQGFLFCIKDNGDSSEPVWRVPTCAPLIKVGDTIIKGGAPEYDPFRPDSSIVIIQSLSGENNYFVQPYFVPNPPSPAVPNTTPIVAVVRFNSNTVINQELVQPVWASLGGIIYQDSNRETAYTLDELLILWREEQLSIPPGETVQHFIWAYVSPQIMAQIQQQQGNNNISYFKFLTSGQVITNAADAQGLNYWGNSTWGQNAEVDERKNLVYFSTGQGHDIPLDESLFYAVPSRNFKDLKNPVIDVIDRYVAGQASLDDVNSAKETFVDIIRRDALDVKQKSPRGRMSYSDGILSAYISSFNHCGCDFNPAGSLAFGVRSIAWDNYSFLSSPQLAVYPLQAIDGDLSSGVLNYESDYIATAGKGGVSPIVDIRCINTNVIFNHNNLREKGIRYSKLVFSGPNGVLGGSNFANDKGSKSLVSSQGNMSWFSGSVSSTGVLERQITQDGRVFEVNNSFIQSFDIPSGEIIWETDYQNRAHAEVLTYNKIVFSEDSEGSLYAFNLKNGEILWKEDGASLGMLGGIVRPVVDNGQVLWTNNYLAFGVVGSPGPNGVSFRVNPNILITKCTSANSMLVGKTFRSWDSFPKFNFPNPAINPEINTIVTHTWSFQQNKVVVDAIHETLIPPSVQNLTFTVKKFDPIRKIVTFEKSTGSIQYLKLKLINTNIYELIYTNDGVLSYAWLKL